MTDQNINEIYSDNPITTLADDDRFYITVDNSTTPDDGAIEYSDLLTNLEGDLELSSVSTGWISYSAVIPTRASADDPTYVLTFAGVNLTGKISVGMRVKWTQNSTIRYGIVTKISFSTNTTFNFIWWN